MLLNNLALLIRYHAPTNPIILLVTPIATQPVEQPIQLSVLQLFLLTASKKVIQKPHNTDDYHYNGYIRRTALKLLLNYYNKRDPFAESMDEDWQRHLSQFTSFFE